MEGQEDFQGEKEIISHILIPMRIGGLQKLTLIDYPGRLAATVFLVSCNFRCSFCYSSELVLPEKIKKQPLIDERDFFDFLGLRKKFLEGVVVCGGEPTVNKELPVFLKKIKKMGYLVKLDTNGTNPLMLKRLLKKNLVDYIAMDVKAPRGKYLDVVKVSNAALVEKVEESIGILKNSGIDYEFRTTVVPGLLGKSDILEIANWLKPARKYFIQNFRGEKTIDPGFENLRPYPDEYLLEIKEAVSPFFEVCRIR